MLVPHDPHDKSNMPPSNTNEDDKNQEVSGSRPKESENTNVPKKGKCGDPHCNCNAYVPNHNPQSVANQNNVTEKIISVVPVSQLSSYLQQWQNSQDQEADGKYTAIREDMDEVHAHLAHVQQTVEDSKEDISSIKAQLNIIIQNQNKPPYSSSSNQVIRTESASLPPVTTSNTTIPIYSTPIISTSKQALLPPPSNATLALGGSQASAAVPPMPNDEDWAARLLSPVHEPTPDETLIDHPGDPTITRRAPREMIVAPFDINCGKRFRHFLTEFEQQAYLHNHNRSGFGVLLGRSLEGTALRCYKNCLGSRLPYDMVKSKMLLILERKEFQNVYPTVPPDIVYDPNEGVLEFMVKITTFLSTYGNTSETQNLSIKTLWERLPPKLSESIQNRALWISQIARAPHVHFNHVVTAAEDHDAATEYIQQQNPKSYAQVVSTQTVTPKKDNQQKAKTQQSESTIPFCPEQLGPSHQNASNKNQNNTSQQRPKNHNNNNSNYSNKGKSNRKSPYCWICASKKHWTTECPKGNFPNRPRCSKCKKKHNWNTITCEEFAAQEGTMGKEEDDQDDLSEKKSKCKTTNHSISNFSFNTNRPMYWSKSNLDEMSNDSNTNQDVDNKNIEGKKQKNSTIENKKHNGKKSDPKENFSFYYKDYIANLTQKERNLINHSFATFQKLCTKSNLVRYECESQTCQMAHHRKAQNLGNKKNKIEKILEKLSEEFPNCEISKLSIEKREKQSKKDEVVQTKEEVEQCSVKERAFWENKEKEQFTQFSDAVCHEPEVTMDRLEDGARSSTGSSDESEMSSLNFNKIEIVEQLDEKSSIASENSEECHKESLEEDFQMEENAIRFQALHMTKVMLVKINIGTATNLTALIDSGATVSTIDYPLTKKIGGNWEPSNTLITGLGEKQGFETYTKFCTDIYLEGLKMKPSLFYSMPKVNLPYDVILGRDFLD